MDLDIDPNEEIDLFGDLKVLTTINPPYTIKKLTNIQGVVGRIEKPRQIYYTKLDCNNWILDTATEVHIVCNRDYYSTFKNTFKQVSWGNVKTITIQGIGSVILKFTDTKRIITLNNCLYMPEIGINLISQANLKLYFVFDEKGVSLYNKTQND